MDKVLRDLEATYGEDAVFDERFERWMRAWRRSHPDDNQSDGTLLDMYMYSVDISED